MRIAIYVRVSTQRQAQTQTIDQQVERLRAHAESQGWQLPEGNVFRDDGYSGATLKRPGLDRLRDRAAMASLDKVLVTDPTARFTVKGEFDGKRIHLSGETSDRKYHDQLINLLIAMKLYEITNDIQIPKTPAEKVP